MRRKFFGKIWIVALLMMVMFALNSGHAAAEENEDPQAGRASGDVSSDFYNTDEEAQTLFTSPSVTQPDKYKNCTIRTGIDVSQWQGDITWKKVAADGIDYAIVRVAYSGWGTGAHVVDSKGSYNLKQAAANGLDVGAYIFSQAITTAEAKEEADFAVAQVKASGVKINLPIVMDYEYASDAGSNGGRMYQANLSKAQATAICIAFCKEVVKLGYTPMVYANANMLTNHLNADVISSSYQVWLANYTYKTSYAGSFNYWQYASDGRVDGINNNVDLDFQYLNVPQTTVSDDSDSFQEETDDEDYLSDTAFVVKETDQAEGVLLYSGVNVRKGPGTNYSSFGTLDKNTSVVITGTSGNWYRVLFNKNNVQKVGYIYQAYVAYASELPSVPTFKISKSYTTKLRLRWSCAENANGYIIYRYNATTKKYVKIATVKNGSTCTYVDRGLTSAATYSYKIRSYGYVKGYKMYSKCVKAKGTTLAGSGTGYIKVKGGANVRTGAGTSYIKIATLSYGTKVTILGTSGSWSKISFVYGNILRQGYILTSSLKLQ